LWQVDATFANSQTSEAAEIANLSGIGARSRDHREKGGLWPPMACQPTAELIFPFIQFGEEHFRTPSFCSEDMLCRNEK
jgi:hypothetical protein